ncbi:MAG: 23S rRNA (uracil(1939)-C(5))-methyltransferase RlmD [Bacteroidetes bacterium]|nr:23S rRNA (uracil(1939)-C(5))-methyltransferase RlmD [Bacteroidota bacterium]
MLVQNYAAEGKSIARREGKVFFIQGAVPGDVVDIQLTRNKKDWAEGEVIHFKKYAAERTEPFCQHFGICGGCQWQMLPYKEQLKYKEQQVADQLQRISKIPLPGINPILGCDEIIHYRNKLEYTFATRPFIPKEIFREMKMRGDSPESAGVGGFHAKGMFDKIVEIDVCHLQSPPTNEIRKAVVHFCLMHKIPFYDIKKQEGWLRNTQIRIAQTGESMVNIIVGFEHEDWVENLFTFLQQTFPQITTWLYTINEKRNDSIADLEPIIFSGRGYIFEKLEHYQYKIGPKSFFQTNTKQAEKLYRVVRDFSALKGHEIIYDLYCGTGSIGLFLSNKAKHIIGVELIREAVDDAIENARLNHIEHADFFQGDVLEVCDQTFFEKQGKPDVIITDPPRAGMHESLVKKLLEIAAPKIVYVSCNPATQARDLALLADQYEVEKIQPVDMFPHTHHIENVVSLTLKEI